jgi:hypothetical protein
MGPKITTLKPKSPALTAPPPPTTNPSARTGAKRSQTSYPAAIHCPKKSRKIPNPSLHSAAANRTHRPSPIHRHSMNLAEQTHRTAPADRHVANSAEQTHRPLLSNRSQSKNPAQNPPTRPQPRQTTPSIDPRKTKPPANSAVPSLHFRGRLLTVHRALVANPTSFPKTSPYSPPLVAGPRPCAKDPPRVTSTERLCRLYFYRQPCYTPPNNCQSLRLSLPEELLPEPVQSSPVVALKLPRKAKWFSGVSLGAIQSFAP